MHTAKGCAWSVVDILIFKNTDLGPLISSLYEDRYGGTGAFRVVFSRTSPHLLGTNWYHVPQPGWNNDKFEVRTQRKCRRE